MLHILLTRDYFYLRSQGLEVEEHSHLPLQLSVAEPKDTIVFENRPMNGVKLSPETPHSLQTRGPLHTFLLNPVAGLSRRLASLPPVHAYEPTPSVRQRLAHFTPSLQSKSSLDQVFDDLVTPLLPAAESQELDQRIEEILSYLDSLETLRVSAQELAEQIALSRSRFLHLFKEELELTVRGYLRWLRTIQGATLVTQGASITEAAHQAGFSDSAHFARTFKTMFGVTLSSVLSPDAGTRVVFAT